jgi:ubiquinol oxidase
MIKISEGRLEYEKLVKSLNDKETLKLHEDKYSHYKTHIAPRLLAKALITVGDLLYGKNPSYIKFRAIEVIARVPYQSWSSAAYTLLTLFYTDERRAIELSGLVKFARHANDNETMHVVVISKIVSEEHKHMSHVLHSTIPMMFSFVYFWMFYALSFINRKWSYELNYLFESHAYSQYSIFVNRYGERLKEKEIHSEFLEWYGRDCKNQYELFSSIRNDELLHRNQSIEEMGKVG